MALHTALIGLHAAAGSVALITGAIALRRGQLFLAYLWSLVAMVGFLALAIAVEWGQNDTARRVLFSAFLVLAGVMLWRAWRAWHTRPVAGSAPSSRYIEHIGFTLIALFDAFVVVAVLNAGAPVWAVVAAGVGIGVAGHFVLQAVRKRLTAPADLVLRR